MSEPQHSASLIPGTVGAVLNTYVGHPFDTIRVRMQQIDSGYKTSMECLKQTYRSEGINGVFKGVTPSLYSMIVESAVVFYVNDNLKQRYFQSNSKTSLNLHQDMMIGSISGLVATVVSCPFETIKCRMQVGTQNKSHQMLELLKSFDSPKAYLRLYSGFEASCIRNAPFYLLFFPFYSRYIDLVDRVVNYVSPVTVQRKSHTYELAKYSIAGGFSGATSWACVYPLDVVKCNQQTYHKQTSMTNMFRLIVQQRGYRGLFAGFCPTIIRAFPANASLLLGVEITHKFFKMNKT